MLSLFLSALICVGPAAAVQFPHLGFQQSGQIKEIPGRVCAYADFNQDRSTDLLMYDDEAKQLYVRLQDGEKKEFSARDVNKGFIVDLDGSHAELACSMGDFNGDGVPDVVVSTRKDEGDETWRIRVFYTDRPRTADKFCSQCSFKKGPQFEEEEMADQVTSVDVNGDGQHDLFGSFKNGSLLCLLSDFESKQKGKTPGAPAFSQSCVSSFPSWGSTLLRKGMPVLLGDITNDLKAELIVYREHIEAWQRSSDGWQRMTNIPVPTILNLKYTLAPILADVNLDGIMELLVPVCKEENCKNLDSIAQLTHSENPDQEWQWKAISVGSTPALPPHENRFARLHVGDCTLDGFPDLIGTFVNEKGLKYLALIENYAVGDEDMTHERRFEKAKTEVTTIVGSDDTLHSSYFFDFFEDGKLDYLYMYQKKEKGWFTHVLIAADRQEDVTFLKVHTTNPLPSGSDIKDGLGVPWGGACVRYTMDTTDLNTKTRSAIDCQLTTTAHYGLSPPFSLLGLGRNPNFVDELTIVVPRPAGTEDALSKHIQKQIVPNARIIVQPPRTDGDGGGAWVLRLYLTPSALIVSSVLVMTAVCVILLLVVVLLHLREKKFDRVERQAQSHRFHFDAM